MGWNGYALDLEEKSSVEFVFEKSGLLVTVTRIGMGFESFPPTIGVTNSTYPGFDFEVFGT